MNHIIYLQGLTSSDPTATEPPLDTAIVDVGEERTVAIIDVRVPTQGEQPIKQFLHSEMLKLLTDDARSQAIKSGKIELRDGHTESDLKNELTKSSNQIDSVSESPRPV